MNPFNPDKLLEGQPVITRAGTSVKVKELRYNNSTDVFLTAVVNGKPVIWDIQGKAISSTDNNLDLFMDQEIVYHWAQRKDILDTNPGKAGYIRVIIPEP